MNFGKHFFCIISSYSDQFVCHGHLGRLTTRIELSNLYATVAGLKGGMIKTVYNQLVDDTLRKGVLKKTVF